MITALPSEMLVPAGFLVVVGCQPAATDSAVPIDATAAALVLADLSPASLTTEHLTGAVDQAGSAEDWQVLWRADGQATLLDERDGSTTALGEASWIAGTWLPDGGSLLALDGDLWLLDGALSPLDFDGAPIERLSPGTSDTWMWGAGRLYRLSDGAVTGVVVEGAATLSDFAVTGETMWLSTPTLLGVSRTDLAVTAHHPEHTAVDLASDGDGRLWLVDPAGQVHLRSADGRWIVLDLSARQVLASPHAPDAWIRTDEGAIHHRDGTFSAADVPEGTWEDIDSTGRLLVAGADGLVRVAWRRPVVFAGHRSGAVVEARTTITLLPADPGSQTEALLAWRDGEPVTIEDGTLTLDPGTGAALRVRAAGEEGTTISVLSLGQADLPDSTWADDIAPLAQAHCASCHGDAAAFPLVTAAAWQEHIDPILEAVTAGTMPAAGPALSAPDVLLITGWQEGGFP